MKDESGKLDACGCCGKEDKATGIENPPGRDSLSYRMKVHSSFFKDMLSRLSDRLAPYDDGNERNPLLDLCTRKRDDPSIAILDAWAAVGDVLTFYQERICNEGFIRTAKEQRSVMELARSIGYELSPGASASTILSFTVEDAPGAPDEVTVPKGSKVESIPEPGELPQVFETVSDFIARSAWNDMKPRLSRPQPLDPQAPQIYIKGLDSSIKAGDFILFVDSSSATPRKVLSVLQDAKLDRTVLSLDNPEKEASLEAVPFERKYQELDGMDLNGENVCKIVKGGNVWSESDLAAGISLLGWSSQTVAKYIEKIKGRPCMQSESENAAGFSQRQANAALAAAPVASGGVSSQQPGLYAFKERSSPFGHNAPRWDSLPDSLRYRTFYGPLPPYPKSWDGQNEPSITTDSQTNDYTDAYFFFERAISEIVPNDWMILLATTIKVAETKNGAAEEQKKEDASSQDVFAEAYRVSGISERTIADYTISAKATGVILNNPDGSDSKEKLTKFKVRHTTILSVSRSLELTDIIIDDPIEKDITSLELNGFVRNLQKGQLLVISGERQDLDGVTASEVVALSRDAEHLDGFTTIYFEPGLKNPYKRDTVRINANAVYADHGETTREVLGSGDGSAVNQEFILKKKPLTYVSSSTSGGRQAAIEVEVDSAKWKECSSFLAQEEIREKYIIRIDNESRAHVIFGDGEKGARLPSGLENIVAEYRCGLGKSGMLAADKLTLLKTKPHGIREVTNPLPTTGGQEPEDMEQARRSTLLHSLSLDSIVSLKDYENYALNYPGIGKAKARMLQRGQQKLVHLTVATAIAEDADAAKAAVEVKELATHALDSTSKLYKDLVEAIRKAGDSVQAFAVNSYDPRFFNLSANVQIESAYKEEAVIQNIREKLESAFSFSNRDFSQLAASSEVIGIIQSVDGVTAIELEKFYFFGDEPSYSSILTVDDVKVEVDLIKKAGLLLINPKGIEIKAIKEEVGQ